MKMLVVAFVFVVCGLGAAGCLSSIIPEHAPLADDAGATAGGGGSAGGGGGEDGGAP